MPFSWASIQTICNDAASLLTHKMRQALRDDKAGQANFRWTPSVKKNDEKKYNTIHHISIRNNYYFILLHGYFIVNYLSWFR